MRLLEVEDLHVSFRTADGIVQAVRGVSFGVDQGQTLGIVGESGSGKSVATQTIMGLTRGAKVSGRALFEGNDLLTMKPEDMRQVRGAKEAIAHQELRADEIRIARKCRKALIGRVTVARGTQGQDLPPALLSPRQGLDPATDLRGSAEYNLALGERRAEIVKEYLTNLGVRPDRIQTRSLGKEAPFCRDSDEPCWSQNRRDHFVITDK